MTPILPIPPDAALTTLPSSDFLPRPGLDVRKENTTTISGGLTQNPQGSDLQAKANDNTSESEDGMGSQMSRMTTTMILPIFGTNTSTGIDLFLRVLGFSLTWKSSGLAGRDRRCIATLVPEEATTKSAPHESPRERTPGKRACKIISGNRSSSGTFRRREI